MTRSKYESGIHQIRVHPVQSNTMKKWTSSSRNVTVVLQIMFIGMLMWIQLDIHDNFDMLLFIQKISSRFPSPIHVRQEPVRRRCYNKQATEWAVEERRFDFRQTGFGTLSAFYSKRSRAAFLGDKKVAMWS